VGCGSVVRTRGEVPLIDPGGFRERVRSSWWCLPVFRLWTDVGVFCCSWSSRWCTRCPHVPRFRCPRGFSKRGTGGRLVVL